MTSIEKIKESEYNLNKLKNTDKWSESYNYEFNSFITSTRSILDHLLNDYNIECDLQIPLDIDLKHTFQKKSKENPDIKKFIDWYELKYLEILHNPVFGFLVKTRNVIIHREKVQPNTFKITTKFPNGLTIKSTEGTSSDTVIPLMLDKKVTEIKITTTDKKTGQQKEEIIPIEPIMECYFKENHTQSIDVICELLLEEIKKMVFEAHSKF